MVILKYLKNAVVVSCLGHMFFFTLFNVTFGGKIKKLDYASISFLGQVLMKSEFQAPLSTSKPAGLAKNSLLPNNSNSLLKKPVQDAFFQVFPYVKPLTSIGLQSNKDTNKANAFCQVRLAERKEPSITFHPSLPYYFTIYFKERQEIQMELQFNIAEKVNSRIIHLKRKISSGNLEADLLTMRYMEHCLFNQQTKFAPNLWQKVKINLTPKEK